MYIDHKIKNILNTSADFSYIPTDEVFYLVSLKNSTRVVLYISIF